LAPVAGIWKPFSSFPFRVFDGGVPAGALAGIFGFLAFRSRIKGVYFSNSHAGIDVCGDVVVLSKQLVNGRNNGFTDFKYIFGYDLREAATQRVLYIVTALTVLIVFLGCAG